MKPDVFLATPTHSGDVSVAYCTSFTQTIDLLGRNGFSTMPSFQIGNAVISFARALLAQRFLDSGAEHMLFVDADIGWEAAGALALIQSPHEVIGGCPPQKSDGPAKVFFARNMRETPTQNLVEVDGLGGAFVKIKRSAMLKMQEAHPELKCTYKGKPLHLLFENIITDDGDPLSEDYAFCERWRRLGGKVFVYPDISFSHAGRKEWRGNMLDEDVRLKAVE